MNPGTASFSYFRIQIWKIWPPRCMERASWGVMSGTPPCASALGKTGGQVRCALHSSDKALPWGRHLCVTWKRSHLHISIPVKYVSETQFVSKIPILITATVIVKGDTHNLGYEL